MLHESDFLLRFSLLANVDCRPCFPMTNCSLSYVVTAWIGLLALEGVERQTYPNVFPSSNLPMRSGGRLCGPGPTMIIAECGPVWGVCSKMGDRKRFHWSLELCSKTFCRLSTQLTTPSAPQICLRLTQVDLLWCVKTASADLQRPPGLSEVWAKTEHDRVVLHPPWDV